MLCMYDLHMARPIPGPATFVGVIWRLRNRLSGQALAITDDDAAVYTLWRLGLRHLAGAHDSERVLAPRDLLIALVTSRDERVEMALVPLFLHTPSMHAHVESAAQTLERRHGLEQHATQLRLYYQAAAYLQRELGMFAGEPLPDLYARRFKGPDVRHVASNSATVDSGLRALARVNAALTHDPNIIGIPIDWRNTYRKQLEVYRFHAAKPEDPPEDPAPVMA